MCIQIVRSSAFTSAEDCVYPFHLLSKISSVYVLKSQNIIHQDINCT